MKAAGRQASAPAQPAHTVIVDSREQRPYPIAGAVIRKLDAGDYSILGCEDQIAVERKSAADLFGTVGTDRARFERELAKLAKYRYAAIVIESDVATIRATPPAFSKLHPHAVLGSLVRWSVRHGVYVWFASSRENGWALTEKILRMFWEEMQDERQRAA